MKANSPERPDGESKLKRGPSPANGGQQKKALAFVYDLTTQERLR